jgi:hypothetical protein
VNEYPIWWSDTLTIYNKYTNPETRVVTWYKYVLNGCFWKYTGNKVTINETIIETDNTLCRIPENDKFLERHEWENLPEESKKEYFTLSTGDIIVKGNVEDVIDEYTSGKRSSDLLTKYRKLQGCMLVEKCSINTGIGRGINHYCVRGV